MRALAILRDAEIRMRKLWLTASPLRALSETLLLAGLVIGLSLLAAPHTPTTAIVQVDPALILLSGPVCATWCALRLRPAHRVWWREALVEGSVGIILGILPFTIVVVSVYIFVVDRGYQLQLPTVRVFGVFPLAWFAALLFGAFSLEFVVARMGVRVALLWNHMRRTQLRWSLTHAQLLAAALASLTIFIPISLFTLSFRDLSVYRLVPAAFVFVVLTSLGLLIMLPSSAVVSMFLARYMNRRLETLTNATAALRAGDYSVRVPVTGEDEVAQLQHDFNTMAGELERAMRDLQAERDTVATLLRSRRELVAGVSHDLRTPVATLRGYLESARARWESGAEQLPDMLRRDLSVMERETLALQSLIDDLFTLSRAEVDRLEMHPEATDAVSLARGLVASMAPLAWQRSRIEVVADIGPGIPPVMVDPHRLEQALRNLAQNALRHTPPGGIIAISVSADAGRVLVGVKDTGEGIRPDELPHIWDRFYRGASAIEKGSGGTGLGLALVKELTEAMGGTVTVRSVPGQGSCFTLSLKAAQAAVRQPHTLAG
ncbi:MAG TPA: HAMP domain-containing sensor histidine kinase [Ktedonobacterales bacterium]